MINTPVVMICMDASIRDYYEQILYSLDMRYHNYKPHFELIHVSVSDEELTALSTFAAYAEHSNDGGG